MLSPTQACREVEGITTEVLLQAFSDRILVLVTQMGKVGNLIQATIPATTVIDPAPPPDPSHPNVTSLPVPPTAIQLTPLLGNAPSEHMQALHSLYASQIATIIWASEAEGTLEVERRGVVVGLALRKTDEAEGMGLSKHEREVFYGIMDMVDELARCK
ncbi:uncharacterized protein LAESUDRAFT_674244 [Laetiporus sulphureus 93-53]|uniref:Proteasome assembly chaperone 3 n=1 Tax=Laetiporus sulphureus 93-53 TaxID=1314785 RepID=A0A165FWU7_9APHY|nr:uncharacterized protein LAESUDRAFT_674244 [Laetiporus sulphureus 93-53]KZT09517.1 hypothetical protein LAESUDRAFT_674244 [Laetiporus sulphureus 93-53]